MGHFLFTGQNAAKNRPALVLSGFEVFNATTQNCVLAMIASANNSAWPIDTNIGSIQKEGLPAPSKGRMKLFTLDSRLIIKKIGGLSAKDQTTLKANLKKLLSL